MTILESVRSFPTPEPTPTIRISFSPHQEAYTYLLGETLVAPGNGYYAAVNQILTFTASIEFHVTDRWAVGYKWEFGDGNFSYSNPATHTYTQINSNLQVALVVTDNRGKKWRARKSMYLSTPEISEILAKAPVTDSLQHATLPESFLKVPWSGSVGTISTSGWSAESFLTEYEGEKAGSRSGIYYKTSKVEGGRGYITAKVPTKSISSSRQMGLWLFSEMTSTPSGYQVAAIYNGSTFTFKLRKWVSGVETLLSETKLVPVESNGSFGLVARNGLVGAWYKKNSTANWSLVDEKLSSTFSKGYSGIDGNGTDHILTNFSTGTF